jgi:hypothetical protein
MRLPEDVARKVARDNFSGDLAASGVEGENHAESLMPLVRSIKAL